jgi:hypothetical protein
LLSCRLRSVVALQFVADAFAITHIDIRQIVVILIVAFLIVVTPIVVVSQIINLGTVASVGGIYGPGRPHGPAVDTLSKHTLRVLSTFKVRLGAL